MEKIVKLLAASTALTRLVIDLMEAVSLNVRMAILEINAIKVTHV